MKKQLLTLVAVCAITMGANAQTEKGDNLIGGSLSISSSKTESANYEKRNFYGINPSYAHFFSKNLAIGLIAGASYSKNLNNNYDSYYNITTTRTSKQKSFSVGPVVRYYIDIIDKLKAFGQFSGTIGFVKTDETYSGPYNYNLTPNTKFTQYNASLRPGFAFFPTKKLGIELGFSLLSYNKIDDDGQSPSNTWYKAEAFDFGFNTFNPFLGFNFHF
ncbi:outer membrane beta-barrel protein [Pedobacter sp. MR2016-19]|uniref:outer membrane beta-barrel protein n=1 Tax=Pedobacter sp. MR2016-19 TaxID=2780089 RepID=UPI0018750D2F|nr:outer membrane beta-barrel protein [Pedobacter sp. MR2016-19]MBE5318532.1 outer membrane beta-barrel protein [Pedobacter sp. MR2016-19]